MMLKACVAALAWLYLANAAVLSPRNSLDFDITRTLAKRTLSRPGLRRRASAPNGTDITYQAGLVLTGPLSFYLIYYGQEWNETDARIPIIEEFVNHVGQTPWWNTIREYPDASGFHAATRVLSVRGRHIDNGSYGFNFTDGYDTLLPTSWPRVINSAISSNNWTVDANRTIFIIVTDQQVEDSTLGGFCRPRRYFFGSSPNGNVAADSIVNSIAHQLANVITNPLYNGWYFLDDGVESDTTIPGEIASVCEWRFSGVKPNATNEDAWNHVVGKNRYLIQNLWSLSNKTCVGTTLDTNSYGLAAGQSLRMGDRLMSKNNEFALVFDGNCTISVRDLTTNITQPQPFVSQLSETAKPLCLLSLAVEGDAYVSDSNRKELWTTGLFGNTDPVSAAGSLGLPDLNSSTITSGKPSFRLEDDGTLALVNEFGRPLWIANVQANMSYFESLTLRSGAFTSAGGGVTSSNGTYFFGISVDDGINANTTGLNPGKPWSTGPISGPAPLKGFLRPDASLAVTSKDNKVEWWSGVFKIVDSDGKEAFTSTAAAVYNASTCIPVLTICRSSLDVSFFLPGTNKSQKPAAMPAEVSKKPPPPPPRKPPPAAKEARKAPEPTEPPKKKAVPSPEFEEYYASIEEDDLQLEDECLRAPYFVKTWLKYLDHKRVSGVPRTSPVVYMIFERALHHLPGSYKLWKLYLERRISALLKDPIDEETGLLTPIKPLDDLEWAAVNGVFERAMVFCNKWPTIWGMYLKFLLHQVPRAITRCRRTFDRALKALPITQHHLIWPEYLAFATRCGGETAVRVWRRYMKLQPEDAESYIEVLLEKIEPPRYAEAARVMTILLEDPLFQSKKGKSKYQIWTELCDLVTEHPDSLNDPTPDNLLGAKGSGVGKVERLPVDKVLKYGISKYTDQVGKIWAALATWWISKGEFDLARDVYEEAIVSVKTVRDFTLVFDAYAEFEEGVIQARMQILAKDDEMRERKMKEGKGDDDDEEEEDDDDELLEDEEREEMELDLDLRLARLEKLIQRRPFLVNDVVLRQNPHNVNEWERRVQLWKERSRFDKVVETYQDAVATIVPRKAVGKFHLMWVKFAKLYEENGDLETARSVFDRAVNVPFAKVDDLAEVWCQWAEMELRRRLPKKALEVMGRATAPPRIPKGGPALNSIRYQDDTLKPQWRLFKSLKLWSFYVDLEESIGTVETAKAVYNRIMDLKIATPQIILNCAGFLEENKYFEESYKAYERGIELFGYPVAFEIWNVYLRKFVERHGSAKLERARDLFEHAIDKVPPQFAKALYIMYAKLEEEHGLARRAMRVYDRATQAVSDADRFDVFKIYVAKAISFFGLTAAREIYEKAIDVLPDVHAREMCVRFAELETKLLEIDRARAVWAYGSQFADPRMDPEYWKKWQDFEVRHGNEETFKEMLRIKRSVQAKYNTDVGFISAQLLAQRANAAETGSGAAPDLSTQAVPNSMSELEKRVLEINAELDAEEERKRLVEAAEKARNPAGVSNTRVVGFVPAKAKDATTGKPVFVSGAGGAEGGDEPSANPDEIEIDDDEDEEEEEAKASPVKKTGPAGEALSAKKAPVDDDADDDVADDGEEEDEELDDEEAPKVGRRRAAPEIQKKAVPAALFGGLLERAAKEKAEAEASSGSRKKVAVPVPVVEKKEETGPKPLGARERFKRKKE
ncbi:pre-mRNA-splicing factor syf1 [Phlyctochytrium bullatum]|nr:pre-mRNA-splicing factor syf1 [Phlyctochytrium bullatum]